MIAGTATTVSRGGKADAAQLGQLREQGVLTDEEFHAEEARILAS
ncbi:hypothetical protein GFS60_04492 [Rhodococcus sp. WAY2]|nr:SHOCT domain-containing protein [Rhodococcus oxybenzonivorans]QHE70899.1 hypothetical protein GFS60_04492 [Rhodococcus sp. WAY2]